MNGSDKMKKTCNEDTPASKNADKNKREILAVVTESLITDPNVNPQKMRKLAEEQDAEKETLSHNTGSEELPLKTESKTVVRNIESTLEAPNNVLSKAEEPNSIALREQLLSTISNLYLNVKQRLRLDFPPRCLDDFAYCQRHHYRSDLQIMSSTIHIQRAFEQGRYVTFINMTTDICLRGEFPRVEIFRKLVELILSINYTTEQQPKIELQYCYNKCIEVFLIIIHTFPPCWHKMREYYVEFLDRGLACSKLSSTKEALPSKSTKVCDILLDLLEDLLKNYSQSDLSFPERDTNSSGEVSFLSKCLNEDQYEEHERQLQTYIALKLDQRLERIFVALRSVLHILEYDLAMWLLHHNKNIKDWICSENRPLIVAVCELTQFTRMTRMVRRIFTIFSESVAKGLCKARLQVLDRYMSLLIIASNAIDIENTVNGVKYPVLGEKTKDLIKVFFEIFEEHNRQDINKYIESIELLRIPFVRYEFINSFLFDNSESLRPRKIAVDMTKKRWLKYKLLAELEKPNEGISREQFLNLLLNALRSYSDWHGLKTFWHIVLKSVPITSLTTTTDCMHILPDSEVLSLKEIAKKVKQLETKLVMTARMCKPKIDLPLADICIDETILRKYREDLKFIISLHSVLLKQKQKYTEVDFSKWLNFLNEFVVEKTAQEPPP